MPHDDRQPFESTEAGADPSLREVDEVEATLTKS